MRSYPPRSGVIPGAAACILLLSCGSAAPGEQESGEAEPEPMLTGGEELVDHFDDGAGPLWSVSHGWSNGSWMVNDWQKSQVSFDSGLALTLAAGVVPEHSYSSGEVQSRKAYGHGYYEARMRAAPGSGVVSGFFTYTGPPFGKPWNEIDVEILGAEPTKLYATYFNGDDKIGEVIELGFDATRNTHIYAFDWQPGWIRWYVDGRLVHETRGEELPLPDEKQKIMVSLWGSETLTDWVGPFEPSSLPTTMAIDCIAYSRKKPLEDRCG